MHEFSGLDARLANARAEYSTAMTNLDIALNSIGMTRSYTGHDPKEQVKNAISAIARTAARVEMLEILSTEDFFLAMTRSAGSVA